MKTLKLKVKFEGESFEQKVHEVLSKQNEICDWEIDSSKKEIIIEIKELLNEKFLIKRLGEEGVHIESFAVEQVPSKEGVIKSTCQ